MTIKAYIGLGSNMGESQSVIASAVVRLEKLSSGVVERSSLWRTSPVDCPEGSADFVNGVIGLELLHQTTAESFLEILQDIERDFGRIQSTVVNAPRPLDLDLLLFGNEIHNSDYLVLPHPRAHLRRFVLQPLYEIAPDLIIPGQRHSVSELLECLATDEVVHRL